VSRNAELARALGKLTLGLDALRLEMRRAMEASFIPVDSIRKDIAELIAEIEATEVTGRIARYAVVLPPGLSLEEAKRRYIAAEVERQGGNITRAAESLSVNRKTIYNTIGRK
jgi:DNA-binding NtrC family response regulator